MNTLPLILLVVVPLCAAPLCVFFRRRQFAWALAFTANSVCLALAIYLLSATYFSSTPLSYALGGWAAPLGIEYRLDLLSAFVAFTVCLLSWCVLLSAPKNLSREVSPAHLPLFYAAYLLCFTGLLGITVTGDAFNLFVFLEISSLSSYALISLGTQRRALWSSFRYLVLGTVGATFILIGVGLLYAQTGTLNMADLNARLPALSHLHSVHTAVAFILLGLGLKIGLFPLHAWLPGVYRDAPNVVSAFLASTATKVAMYALIRFCFTVFGSSLVFERLQAQDILMLLALAAILFGSIAAIKQSELKSILAYSSLAQIGYTILGISLADRAGLAAAIVHLFNHALTKGALFLIAGALVYQLGNASLSQLRGMGRSMPWTFAALVLAGISLIGLPATAGFISKWYLVSAALGQGLWWLALIVLACSLLAVWYVWRIIEPAYFSPPVSNKRQEAPLILLLPIWFLVLLNIYFGLDTSFNAGIADLAAMRLLEK